MVKHQATLAGILIDLADLGERAKSSGPQWSHESTDLDLTLLTWTASQGIASHVNDEVDVMLVVVAGAGEVTVNDDVYRLQTGQALLIPKGTQRSIRCTGERFSYLSLHRRRRGLWPTLGTTGRLDG
jgi:quercetin dioxygenase-like cupin family protein